MKIGKAEKDTQTQRFHQESHARIHLFQGPSTPENSLCSCCVFSLKLGKMQTQRILKGGDGGAEKYLCVRFLWVFFFAL